MSGAFHTAAVEYARAGWEVFPVTRKKVPMTAHGMLDATCDVEQVDRWWSARPNANIGLRPAEAVVVIDIDPRNGGEDTWQALIAEHGDVTTLTSWSGSGDGGRHLYFVRPSGKLRGRAGQGIDVKTRGGFVVVPPSLHGRTLEPYRWENINAPIAEMPSWLAKLIVRPVELPRPRRPLVVTGSGHGESIADWFTNSTTWAQILGDGAGWWVVDGDGESDGSGWKHPNGSTECSATIRHGQLFVYSTTLDFEPTNAEEHHGYTRFRAWAVLNHGGDLSAAARAARQLKDGTTLTPFRGAR